MLLTSITLTTSKMVNSAEQAGVEFMLREEGNRLKSEIESYIRIVQSHPNSTYEQRFELHPTGLMLSYTLGLTPNQLYMNSTYHEAKVKRPIYNPYSIPMYGNISSHATSMYLLYSASDGTPGIDISSSSQLDPRYL